MLYQEACKYRNKQISSNEVIVVSIWLFDDTQLLLIFITQVCHIHDSVIILLVLCRVEKLQVGSGSGNCIKNRVGSVRVESGNVNIKLLHFLLPTLFNADKAAD